MKLANFDDLQKWGILDKINNEFLHPLGLKMIVNKGKSPGCLISEDLYFPNLDEDEMKRKFELFVKNRYYYLKNYIEVRDYQNKIKKKRKKKQEEK